MAFRLVQMGENRTEIEWLETIQGGPGYRIKKLRYEALPDMWIPALLYEPQQISGRVPAILNVNGHSPEGKAYVPKQIRCINQAKRGMLALNLEWLGMGQLRTPGFDHGRMNQLDLCGASGLAPFYLALQRGLETYATALVAKIPSEGDTTDRAKLFPQQGLAEDTVRLSATDTFGLADFNNVLTGEYTLTGMMYC